TEASTGQPLEFAQIFTQDDRNRVTRSDAQGRYRLAGLSAGEHTLVVREVGYSSKSVSVTVAAGQTVTVDFQLEAQPLQLDEIVVTGQGGEMSKRRIATQADVVGTEAIEASPATRIDQLLQSNLPGA